MKSKLKIGIIGVLISAATVACRSDQKSENGKSVQPSVVKQPRIEHSPEHTQLVNERLFQEAVWIAEEHGYSDIANSLRERLKKILTEGEFKLELRNDLPGMTHKYLFHYTDGITAIFKYDGKFYTSEHTWAANAKSEVAAYEFDRIFHFNLVPMTVLYTYEGKEGSLQYWIKGVNAGKGKDTASFSEMQVFDYITGNPDRYVNENNWLYWEKYQRVIGIDHGVAFLSFEAGCLKDGVFYMGVSDPCGEPVVPYPSPEKLNLKNVSEKLRDRLLSVPDSQVIEVLTPYVTYEPYLKKIISRLHNIRNALMLDSSLTGSSSK